MSVRPAMGRPAAWPILNIIIARITIADTTTPLPTDRRRGVRLAIRTGKATPRRLRQRALGNPPTGESMPSYKHIVSDTPVTDPMQLGCVFHALNPGAAETWLGSAR